MSGTPESLKWDADTWLGNTDTRGFFMEVTEFDYRAVNEIIYQETGVTILPSTIPLVPPDRSLGDLRCID